MRLRLPALCASSLMAKQIGGGGNEDIKRMAFGSSR